MYPYLIYDYDIKEAKKRYKEMGYVQYKSRAFFVPRNLKAKPDNYMYSVYSYDTLIGSVCRCENLFIVYDWALKISRTTTKQITLYARENNLRITVIKD